MGQTRRHFLPVLFKNKTKQPPLLESDFSLGWDLLHYLFIERPVLHLSRPREERVDLLQDCACSWCVRERSGQWPCFAVVGWITMQF